MIEVVAVPGDTERDAILAPLVAFNDAAVGPTERHPIAIVIRADHGAIVGGLWGMASYRWLFVQYLVVPASMGGHGHGSALMLAAESEARRLDCVWPVARHVQFPGAGLLRKAGLPLLRPDRRLSAR